MTHALPELPWALEALEPNYLKSTMEFHYSKHHQAYVNNLNKALEGLENFANLPIEELMTKVNEIPAEKRQPVINNGGGHYNHTLFWFIMGPNAGGNPTGALAEEINKSFGSFDKFKEDFAAAATTQFGSGWAWLTWCPENNKLLIEKSANQDNCLMNSKRKPLMTIDVWEHAYYLEHQNLRPRWIETFWKLVNWTAVADNFEKAKAGKTILEIKQTAKA
ncbi:MAG: superoxide dismutase [Candidatus Caenarcaniphilales bacterium]|jgi:Fe-Mn family superoxide dismutase|nr:superoxide dismutase [Candidatus Caenarcaniphilales bacterium]